MATARVSRLGGSGVLPRLGLQEGLYHCLEAAISRLGAHRVRCCGTLKTCVRCGSRRPAPRVVTAAFLAAAEPDFAPAWGR